MSVFDFARQQDATYWARGVSDGFGSFAFSTPEAIKVRWENKTEQKLDDDGIVVLSRASVWVGKDMSTGDYLYLGVSTSSDPAIVQGAFRILSFDKTPDLFNADFERIAFL